eukprot:4007696-Prymnesium_polylepis.1
MRLHVQRCVQRRELALLLLLPHVAHARYCLLPIPLRGRACVARCGAVGLHVARILGALAAASPARTQLRDFLFVGARRLTRHCPHVRLRRVGKVTRPPSRDVRGARAAVEQKQRVAPRRQLLAPDS